MKNETLTCIGGTAHGKRISMDSQAMVIPVPQLPNMLALPVLDEPPDFMPTHRYKRREYRIGGRSVWLWVYETLCEREALDLARRALCGADRGNA